MGKPKGRMELLEKRSGSCRTVTGSGEQAGTRASFNGADGISDLEHVALGGRRVDGNAARVAGASTGSARDQGPEPDWHLAVKVAASDNGNERASFNGVRHRPRLNVSCTPRISCRGSCASRNNFVSPSLFRKGNIAWINIEQIDAERL